MAKSPDFKEAYNQDLNTDYMPPRADYMPPRNPKSVLYTVKTTISPDKKHTCLEMKNLQIVQLFNTLWVKLHIFRAPACIIKTLI